MPILPFLISISCCLLLSMSIASGSLPSDAPSSDLINFSSAELNEESSGVEPEKLVSSSNQFDSFNGNHQSNSNDLHLSESNGSETELKQDHIPTDPVIVNVTILSPSAHDRRLAEAEAEEIYVEAYRKWLTNVRNGYENYIRPSFGGGPVIVSISIYVMAFRSVSEVTMDYSIEIYFRQTWIDRRLAFNESEFGGAVEIDVDAAARYLLWRPDTNLVNAISSVDPIDGSMSHIELMRVDTSGKVLQSKRVSLTAECSMDLRMYPFDEQVCKLIISSYGFRSQDIIYEWSSNAIELSSTTQLPDFEVRHYETKQFIAAYATGNFSTLEVCFILRRNAGYCIVQLMLPATVLVGSSWISLWLESEMAYSDVMGVILSILFLSYSYNNVMPKVSYVKGMDIYLGACLLFTFFSLVKMAIVKYMRKSATKQDEAASASCRRSRLHSASRSLSRNLLVGKEAAQNSAPNSANNHINLRSREPSVTGSTGFSTGTGLKPVAKPVTKTCSSEDAVAEFLERLHEANRQKVHTRAWRRMKIVHYGSQMAFPVAFAAFCVFFFVAYPLTQPKVSCG